MKEKVYNRLPLYLALILSIKMIFVDFGIDAEYQLAMAYRMCNGDLLVKDMWEPHQTSAFLCFVLLKLFISVFKTTRFSVLFLQICGIAIQGLTSVLFYHEIRKITKEESYCKLSAFLLFILFPKDMCFPEFANMQVWFSIILFIFVMKYYRKPDWKHLLYISVIQICLILSYPSCIITYLVICLCIYFYGNKKDIFTLTLFCGILGIGYLLYIFRGMDFDSIKTFINHVLSIEPSHNSSSVSTRVFSLLTDSAMHLCSVLMLLIISALLSVLISKIKKYTLKESVSICLFSFVVLCMSINIYLSFAIKEDSRYNYTFLFPLIIGFAIFLLSKFDLNSKRTCYTGIGIGTSCFISTVLLTDLPLIANFSYLKLAVAISVFVILTYTDSLRSNYKIRRLGMSFIMAFLIMVFARNIYTIRPIYGQIDSINNIRGIVKEGPATGIFSNYMSAYIQNKSFHEFSAVSDGSSIYLCGSEIDTLAYMYKNTTIAAPSVMSTPTYNENLIDYWQNHRDKFPNVVIVSCWYGDLNSCAEESTWLSDWLENEFKYTQYIDGSFWRFYYR